MSQSLLHEALQPVTDWLKGRDIKSDLVNGLNNNFSSASEWYQSTLNICKQGIREGWLCQHEAGGIKYGRVFKPNEALSHFSVDVVLMKDVVGPHHSHPNGEVNLVLPLTEGAAFDGVANGWTVYEAGSAHRPTVAGGEAIVIYLLPEGAIQFTR